MRVIFVLLLLLLTSCSPSRDSDIFSITSWNTYCFFDGVDNSSEFTEFTSAKGYTRAKYEERIERTALYMALNMSDSDIIILEEIESEDVLHDLIDAGLKGKGYLYYGLAQKSDGTLSVGFISRIKPSSVVFHSVSSSSSRLIPEFRFIWKGESVTLLGVHLRSQFDDEDERKEELGLLRTLIEERKGECVIVMGDFNTDCITGDEIGDRRKTGDWIIPLTGDGALAYGGVMFSPYLDYSEPLAAGSYYYDGSWYTYDNALLSSSFFDGEGIEYDAFSITSGADSKTSYGTPLKYEKSSASGYSDHFAITLRLRYH